MLNNIIDKEIDLITWILPMLNTKGKEKYRSILNQLYDVKTLYGGVVNG